MYDGFREFAARARERFQQARAQQQAQQAQQQQAQEQAQAQQQACEPPLPPQPLSPDQIAACREANRIIYEERKADVMLAKQIQKQEETGEPPSLPKSLAPDQLAPRSQELRNISREQHARNLKAARASELEGTTEKVFVTPAELKHLMHIRMREARLKQANVGNSESRMSSNEDLQADASVQPEQHTMGSVAGTGEDTLDYFILSSTAEESRQQMEAWQSTIMCSRPLSIDEPSLQTSNNAFSLSPRAVRLETLPLSLSKMTEPASKAHSEKKEGEIFASSEDRKLYQNIDYNLS
jgi:hypothetical protein